MPILKTSLEADQDLVDIWLYIAEDSPINADRYLDKINDTSQRLAEFKDMGTERPELAKALFCFPLDHYVLYYRKTEGGIELVRVLHAFRDVVQLF
ncbi:MAG: type II toxin-antitoxin system RelE/ParE family toxin [Gammaproteobacteria bacterium]|nr:type II toxin-antitoxin system RelE/ParE family toxin [Gammaproteobacteria bacterium]